MWLQYVWSLYKRRSFHKLKILVRSYIVRQSLQLQFVWRDPPLLSKKSLQYIIAIFISSINFWEMILQYEYGKKNHCYAYPERSAYHLTIF
jgi:hypothetical protein